MVLSASDIVAELEQRLIDIGFKFSDDEDYDALLEALGKVRLVRTDIRRVRYE